MFDKILVVCVGNICRSPTGERVLQQLLPNKNIASAGIAAEKSRL
ncbi:MAG: low molecular weight phosphotyrosine protein phosphatase, partial [Vibrio toranzoniae]